MSEPHPTPFDDPAAPGEAARRFRALHERFFVMPNPWDIASAHYLASLGFKALATSSSAFAWTVGARDGGLMRGSAISHAASVAAATGLPINGDFEAGYGATPEAVGETITAAIDAGVAGCSIEDLHRGGPEPLYGAAEACRRIEAAREAIERAGSPFVLTVRCEAFLTADEQPLATIRERLPQYRAAGGDVLYAPATTTAEAVEAVLEAADGLPVNVLGGAGGISDDLSALEVMGVKRISLGSGLARVAMGAFHRAAAALADGRVALEGKAAFADIERTIPGGLS